MNVRRRLMTTAIPAALALCLGLLVSACSMGRPAAEAPGSDLDLPREIEESDLYKLVGSWLYVQNPTAGLTVIDVSDPAEPVIATGLAITGEAGELYVRESSVYVLFETVEPACELEPVMQAWATGETSEVVAVLDATSAPMVGSSYCLPGSLVASRIVGDILYVMTAPETDNSRTWLLAIDISNPEKMVLADLLVVDGQSVEVFVNDQAIFLAQRDDPAAASGGTTIRYIDISDPEGTMVPRGEIWVEGEPQGRFHMDATANTFRIVTYSGLWAGTNLHVVDISDPDDLVRMSSFMGLAPDEELWATRFDGSTVYIVTYLRTIVYPRDPLWVISLTDPQNPVLLGELEIPGWSNYIFPRGDRLVAVGRGDRGQHVAVSLYDVSDPTSPAELRRLEFGGADSTSEANADFRGVRILDDETFGELALVTVPYTRNVWTDMGCQPHNFIQIIDLQADDIELRGKTELKGTIRRSVPIGDKLYAISDKTVAALDIEDRDEPAAVSTLVVGDPEAADQCSAFALIDPEFDGWGRGPMFCSVSAPGADSGGWPPLATVAVASLFLIVCFRRRR